MVEVTIADGGCHIEVLGWDKLWAFKSRFDIPLRHIKSVRAEPITKRDGWQGIRAPGTQMPGVICAGTYYQHGKRIFVDIRNPKKTVVIDLTDEKYNQLVVEVSDPGAVVRQIEEAIKGLGDV